MNIEQILQNQSLTNRNLYNQKILKMQRQQEEHIGKILSYDSTSAAYRVRLQNGRIITAQAISNSSAISINSSASIVTPASGTAIIDAMPN